jgi:hypothetical protein
MPLMPLHDIPTGLRFISNKKTTFFLSGFRNFVEYEKLIFLWSWLPENALFFGRTFRS